MSQKRPGLPSLKTPIWSRIQWTERMNLLYICRSLYTLFHPSGTLTDPGSGSRRSTDRTEPIGHPHSIRGNLRSTLTIQTPDRYDVRKIMVAGETNYDDHPGSFKEATNRADQATWLEVMKRKSAWSRKMRYGPWQTFHLKEKQSLQDWSIRKRRTPPDISSDTRKNRSAKGFF